MATDTPYDQRYLAGIVLFNRGDFFEAHEVWESLWMDTAGEDKRFYQALIQAAVGLLHFCNGNIRGAVKLYRSSRDYMSRYGSPHLGLDQKAFWAGMECCFAPLLAAPESTERISPVEEDIPEIALEPAPAEWPDPAAFVEEEQTHPLGEPTMHDDYSPLSVFSGMARLFPLPNLVFYPQVMQPLHIFEPRYRQMAADALAGDRLIALVLPKPGWEADYAGSPPVHSVACLGKIVADQRMDDGRYNILLRGLGRVQILHEIPHGKTYRKAKVELLAEVPVAEPKAERRLRRQLSKLVPQLFSKQDEVKSQFRKLLKSDLSLGALCDIFAFALPLEVEFKQALLEELEVEARLNRLFEQLEKAPEAVAEARKFPPEFSVN